MANLIPSGESAPTPFGSRLTRRAVGVVRHNGVVEATRIETNAELQALRVQGVGYVAKTAMQEVAMVSQLEQQLAQLVPMATSRLQAIGDITAMAMAEVVSETGRRLR